MVKLVNMKRGKGAENSETKNIPDQSRSEKHKIFCSLEVYRIRHDVKFCLFVLRFYGPVNPITVMLSWSVNLLILFLGRLCKKMKFISQVKQ